MPIIERLAGSAVSALRLLIAVVEVSTPSRGGTDP